MAGLPSDSRYVTGNVPPEMREGAEIGAHDVAAPTEIVTVPDGQTAQITRLRFPKPDHIPAGPPKLDPLSAADYPPGFTVASNRALRYDFPLFPGVQCRVVFEGDATADHLEQLCEYLNVACQKLRAQAERRKAEEAAIPRKPAARKVKEKADGSGKTC